MSILENFWLRMAGMFGHTWASQYGDNPSGIGADTWSAALADISPMQIAHGLRETLATGAEFPPSAPRFRAMCLSVPSLASVKYTIRTKQYDRFVALVMQHLDMYTFTRADQRSADRLLREAYEVARDHVMRGGDLPPIPMGHVEGPKESKPVRAAPEVARPYVETLAKLLAEAEAAEPQT